MDYQPGLERFVNYEEWYVQEVKDGLAEVENGDSATAAQIVAQIIWDSTTLLEDQPGIGRPGRVANVRELVIPGLPYSYLTQKREG